jgi:Icc-related predicted phosphoesterase
MQSFPMSIRHLSTIAVALSLLPTGSLTAQHAVHGAVSGTVFVDSNENGRHDRDEPAVAGAVISDQVTVSTTNSAGKYHLDSATFDIVSVTAPPGYQAAGPFWRHVDPDDNRPVDFPLKRVADKEEFTFIHASDTHVSDASVDRLRRLRTIVATRRPDFVLITGDLVRDALRVDETQARGLYEMYLHEIGQFPVPVWNVPGNHEIFGIERHLSLVSKDHPLYGKGMYRSYLGPTYFSFNYGRIHFVGLDSVDYDDLWYYGHVDNTQLAWLTADLATVAAGTTVVTFNHIPLLSSDVSRQFSDEEPAPTLIRVRGVTQFRHVVSNRDDVRSRLKGYDHTLALAGHIHYREMIRLQGDDTRFYTSAAVVGPSNDLPSGVVLYRVRGNTIDDGEFISLD